MPKEPESLKIAIWVCTGLLLGALLMFALQNLIDSKASEQAVKNEETSAVASDCGKADQYPAQTATGAGQTNPGTAPTPQAVTVNPELLPVPSPYPVSTALAALNGSARSAGEQISPADTSNTLPAPGTSLSETSSGYPIVTGVHAVDSPFRSIDPETREELPAQAVGRNGLLSNPCVDPPSVHGAAYGRTY